MTENTNPEAEAVEESEATPEVALLPVDIDSLGDLARLVLNTYAEQAAAYNSGAATLEAATGDASKAIHDIRDNSDDPKVVKFRKFREDHLAKVEEAEKIIQDYIRENLVPETMTDEEVEAEKARLKELKSTAQQGRDFFLAQPAVKSLVESGKYDFDSVLVPLKGARKSVSKGTGTGSPKPRVKAIYIDGDLVSHEVVKDGKTEIKSTFTDAVKFLSDATKSKVETSTLHSGYFEAAGTTDVNAAPDSVEYIVTLNNKDGESTHYTILVTK
jgi:hypothetical protein